MTLIDQIRLDLANHVKAAVTFADMLLAQARAEGRAGEVPLIELAKADAIVLADSAAKAVNVGLALDRQGKLSGFGD